MRELIRRYSDGVLFDVTVKPGSGRGRVRVSRKNGIVVSVVNPAVKGRANRELVRLLGSLLNAEVTIHKADKNYRKTLFAAGIDVAEAGKRLDIDW